MTPYKHHRPTQFDRAGAFLDDDRQDWLVCPVTRTRDSGPMEESNFHAFLEGLGGEGGNVEVHRFGHWGPGWYEIIIINPKEERLVAEAEAMEASLDNYPVLNEEDLSKRENDAENDAWVSWGRSDFSSALKREVEHEWSGVTEHGFKPEEIDDAFHLLTDEDIDCLWHNAADKANWICEHHSDGPSFNTVGVLNHVNVEEVVEMIDSRLWKERVDTDIRKLCACMNSSHIADLAVSMQCTLVSQIRNLQLKTK
jgi:hypothetical protein